MTEAALAGAGNAGTEGPLNAQISWRPAAALWRMAESFRGLRPARPLRGLRLAPDGRRPTRTPGWSKSSSPQHGFAWFATYVAALEQMLPWAERLAAQGPPARTGKPVPAGRLRRVSAATDRRHRHLAGGDLPATGDFGLAAEATSRCCRRRRWRALIAGGNSERGAHADRRTARTRWAGFGRLRPGRPGRRNPGHGPRPVSRHRRRPQSTPPTRGISKRRADPAWIVIASSCRNSASSA